MEQSKIIQKIKRLLALSKSSNQHEAQSALEKAHLIMLDHNLQMSDLETDNESYVIDTSYYAPQEDWIRALSFNVANLYFCLGIFTPMDGVDNHIFIGEIQNVSVAVLMFDYLIKDISRRAHEEAMSQPINKRESFAYSFKVACVATLIKRIEKIILEVGTGEYKVDKGTTLPALSIYTDNHDKLMKYVDEKFPGSITKKDAHLETSSTDGDIKGKEAGKEISLNTQIKKEKKFSLLGRR